jgi:AraC-like DNA-binding protein
MSIIVAVFLIVECLAFLLNDLSQNHSHYSRHLAIRLMAGLTGVALVSLELMTSSHVDTRYLSLDIAAAVEILLLYPCSYEKPTISFTSALILEAAVLISLVYSLIVPSGNLSFRSERLFFSHIVVLVIFASYFMSVAAKRISGIRMFFRNAAVWHSIEDYSRFIYSLAFLGLGILSLCAVHLPGDAGEIMAVLGVVLYMALFAILYLRDMTGRTYVMPRSTERKVKDIIKGNLRTSFIDKAEEDKKMNNLYSRVMLYMNEKQPFLDPDFRMENMAEDLYSNKLYLSRTINLLSGRNFRQFLNYHRIQYAISLFKKDPRLKVGEVASMSGFNSAVSFNMAFKVNMGKTPSEWLNEHSLDR